MFRNAVPWLLIGCALILLAVFRDQLSAELLMWGWIAIGASAAIFIVLILVRNRKSRSVDWNPKDVERTLLHEEEMRNPPK